MRVKLFFERTPSTASATVVKTTSRCCEATEGVDHGQIYFFVKGQKMYRFGFVHLSLSKHCLNCSAERVGHLRERGAGSPFLSLIMLRFHFHSHCHYHCYFHYHSHYHYSLFRLFYQSVRFFKKAFPLSVPVSVTVSVSISVSVSLSFAGTCLHLLAFVCNCRLLFFEKNLKRKSKSP